MVPLMRGGGAHLWQMRQPSAASATSPWTSVISLTQSRNEDRKPCTVILKFSHTASHISNRTRWGAVGQRGSRITRKTAVFQRFYGSFRILGNDPVAETEGL